MNQRRKELKRDRWQKKQLKANDSKPERVKKPLLELLTVVGFVVALLFFWPRLSVEADPLLVDPTDPHPLSFKLTNASWENLYDIHIELGFCEIMLGDPKTAEGQRDCKEPRFVNPHIWNVARLEPDRKYTFRIDDLFSIEKPATLSTLDISLNVAFRPGWWPWRWPESSFRFYTRLERDGKLSWQSR